MNAIKHDYRRTEMEKCYALAISGTRIINALNYTNFMNSTFFSDTIRNQQVLN